MSLKEKYRLQYPDFPWLDAADPLGIEDFVLGRGWLAPGESMTAVEKAGEGNMNLTLRIRTDRRTFILKQSRPWVEKYDHIEAPWDRAQREILYYERVKNIEGVGVKMPQMLGEDAEARVILLEDLEDAKDLSSLYNDGEFMPGEISALALYLVALHSATRGSPDPVFANREMRALNHFHIYDFPYDKNNGMELDGYESGLGATAEALKNDAAFMRVVKETGKTYLADGPCLLHGDYFPGSWMRAPEISKEASGENTAFHIRVIDPEFCFYGAPEWDAGCALAHFVLFGGDGRAFLSAYLSGLDAPKLDAALCARFAGCEVARRLLGIAQLPLPPSTGTRRALLARAREAVCSGELSPLLD